MDERTASSRTLTRDRKIKVLLRELIDRFDIRRIKLVCFPIFADVKISERFITTINHRSLNL